MNPEQNPQPQHPLDGQQLVAEQPNQQPVTSSAQPVSPVSPVQTPLQEQPPDHYQQPKQSNKLTPIIIGAVILISVAVGAFLIFGGDQPETTNQSNTDQNTTAAQDEVAHQAIQEQANEPSAEQTQFDTQRKVNSAKLTAAAVEYAAMNNGKFLTASEINNTFITQYLNGAFNDPSTGIAYKIVETDPVAGEIQYKVGATCGFDNTLVAGNKREIATRVLLSNGNYYCSSS